MYSLLSCAPHCVTVSHSNMYCSVEGVSYSTSLGRGTPVPDIVTEMQKLSVCRCRLDWGGSKGILKPILFIFVCYII